MNKKFLSGIKFFSLALVTTAFTACNESEMLTTEFGDELKINIQMNQNNSRGLITGTTMPENSQIGVSLVDNSGITYDNANYQNICYTANNVDGSQKWSTDKTVILSETAGTVYAYYPYNINTDINAMQIETASQTDYLYGTPVNDISENNSTAQISMNHALTNIKTCFKNEGYNGEGEITNITIKSNGFGTQGILNVKTGEYSAVTGGENGVTDNTVYSLGNMESNVLVVPTKIQDAIKVELTLDGNTFNAETLPLTLEKGRSYNFNLYIKDNKLEISTFSVTEWIDVNYEDNLVMDKADEYDKAVVLQYYIDESNFTSSTTGVEVNVLSSNSNFKITDIDKMTVDGTAITPSVKYTFTTPGFHIVKVLPTDIESIPEYMCFEAVNLVAVSIPSNIKNISNTSFNNCSKLTSISVHEDNLNYNSQNGCNAIIETATGNLVLGCKSTVIPDNVNVIGNKAFYGCKDLSGITIPSSVTEYGQYAFYGGENFNVSIFTNQSVKKIGDYAFLNSKINVPVVFSDVLEEVGKEIIGYNTGIETVEFGTGIQKIGAKLFGSSQGSGTIKIKRMTQPVIAEQGNTWGTTTIVIPDGAIQGYWEGFEGNKLSSFFKNIREENSITENGFLYSADKKTIISCSNYTASLAIPDGVEQLYPGLFYYCDKLIYVQLPNTLKRIGWSTFIRTGLMGELTIPNSVTTIDDWVFATCEDLTVVNLGTSLETIGNYAFSNCSALTKITVPNTVKNIGQNAFYECSQLSEFTIPSSLKTIEENTFSGCDGLTNITIPSNVISIGKGAFSYSAGLSNVIIESGVQTIGESAFQECTALSSVDLGSTIQTIGTTAFWNCSNLSKINIKAENAPVITYETFRGIKSNGILTVPAGKKEVYAYWMKAQSYYLGSLNWTIQEADE